MSDAVQEHSTDAARSVADAVSPSLARLPRYTRSLLKIALPVSVQLASRKESVQEIVEMSPGSVVTFEKRCDELLQLVIGDQVIAEGEAVKIGDKFGFRVHQMVLPEEHFLPVRASRPQDQAPAAEPEN